MEMKKILPIFVIGILILSGLGAVVTSESENEITEKILFSEPTFQETEDFVIVDVKEATTYSSGYGEPHLPIFTKVYTLPFGSKVTNVEVTFSALKEQKLSKLLKPAASPRILSSIYPDDYVEPDINTLYKNIDVYPAERYRYSTGAGLDGEEHVTYLSVSVYPAQYYPESNTLYYSDEATINIIYEPPENPVNFPDVYDFLIIAPEEFKSALQPLVNYKNSLNSPVKTKLVTLEDIPSQGGADEQEDIKYFIRDAIEDWGITYLLLVGAGVEGEEIFPVRKAWISDDHEPYFPSDLYYADIYNSGGGFSNWDRDVDGKYAEYSGDIPNVDGIPDVYLGKLLCNNVQEVNTVVNKIIRYEKFNKMTQKILQMGGDTFTEDGVYEGEYANQRVMLKFPDYTSIQLWASTETLTKPNIRDGFHSNVDFVHYSGHGGTIMVATHPPYAGGTWVPPGTDDSPYDGFYNFDFDIYLFMNMKLPVCVYNACSVSKYSESDQCFSWQHLSKIGGGGIAVFGSSGISYGHMGTDVINFFTGWMVQRTFDEFSDDKIGILGKVWGISVTAYYNRFYSQDITFWKTLLEWSMIGDPTLKIENGDLINSRSVNHPMPLLFERIMGRFPRLERLLYPIIQKL